ncbi:MAG: DUF2089 domain-containing protein [Clostridia bacterium]|nr:DUF2089 domain-containing protein [Clostridia bacterium]MDR3644038.1 DUF2089 domain-containing protein [Clostridia bacterium]
MNYLPPSKCSVCGSELLITRMTCPNCSSEISGSFAPCRYCALNDKMKLFLETFLKCRGNIKDVEKALSISYPTVKGLLEELLAALFGAEPEKSAETGASSILDSLEKGEITVKEATELLSRL